jgi:hypothetical protein
MTTVSEIIKEASKPSADGQPYSYQPAPAAEGWQGAGIRLTEQQLRARRARSIAIALALGAFVAVIFAVTIVRLGSAALERPMLMQPPGAAATGK